jgi:limonene-1,2-epoxide hydrolase
MNAEEVVRTELGAWSTLDVDTIMQCFADDAVWNLGQPGTFEGSDAIRAAVAGFVDRMSYCDMEIINLAVAGDIVLTERIDHFTMGDKTIHLPIMGAFEVTGDKVSAWRDYNSPPEL